MKFPTACHLVIAFGLTATLAFGATAQLPVLRLTGYEATPRYTGVRFESTEKHYWRTLVFMDSDAQFLEITPKQNGLLDWSYVTAIRLTPDTSDSSRQLMTLEFIDKGDQRHKTFELGLIDKEHLAELKRRYGRYLKFETP